MHVWLHSILLAFYTSNIYYRLQGFQWVILLPLETFSLFAGRWGDHKVGLPPSHKGDSLALDWVSLIADGCTSQGCSPRFWWAAIQKQNPLLSLRLSSGVGWEVAVTPAFQLNRTVCAMIPAQPFLSCCTLRHKDCFLLYGFFFGRSWMLLWLGRCCFCTGLTVFATLTNTQKTRAALPGIISQCPSLPKIPVIGMLQRRADN